MNSVNNIFISDLLPPNLKEDKSILQAAVVLDKELMTLTREIEKVLILPYIGSLDNELLDILAEQFDAPYYRTDLEISKKRKLVEGAINWHKKKGTVGAVEELISIVFSESKVQEWFEYGGEPYRFKVITTDIITSEAVYKEFYKAIKSVKNTRSWLEALSIKREQGVNIFWAGQVHIAKYITISQDWFSRFEKNEIDRKFKGNIQIAKKLTIGCD